MSYNKSGSVRLLFLLPSYTFGGAERTSLNLLTNINKERFKICLVTSKKLYQYFNHLHLEKFLPVEDLSLDVWFNSLKRFMLDIRTVASLLKTEKPDLAFGMMHYPSALLVFAKKLFNINSKVIVSPRGPSMEYLRYFEKDYFRRTILKGIFSFFCKYANGLIVASDGMKEECIRHLHAPARKIKVVPNSVDTNDIRIKAEEDININIPQDAFIISTSGRIEREKNLPFLLEAFCEIRKKESVKLLVLGDGSERQNLERFSEGLGIAEHVIFAGYQKNPYKFIQRSDMFVHTCLFEGFGNAIIEAMACRVPVVALDCPYGPASIITNGEDGLLVKMNDKDALIMAITKLLNDKILRDKIAHNGYIRAEAFSINNMVMGYEGFFEHINSLK